MKFLFPTILSLCITISAFAQPGTIAQQGCATPPPSQADLQAIYDWAAAGTASKTTAGTDTIPLTVHIVGTSAGTGYYSLATLWKMLCNTNERYQPAGIYYQLQWPVRYINNSAYYIHNSSSGFQMMVQNNVPNTINVYFVSDPSGACGYFSPGADGVAIAIPCASVGSTTLTHELGHFLGLPHTFVGWEGGNTPSNPEKVTRGPGANCSTAADGFCDTEADYQSERWNCPYTGTMTDVTGTPYHPDSSIYMGYATDACMSRFSGQQISRMQSRLVTNRPNLLAYNAQPYQALDTPTLNYPLDSMYANDRTIRWQAVPGADYYHVVVTRLLGGQVFYDTLVQGTSLLTTHAATNYNRYRVRITPLASSNVCAAKTRERTYYYSPSIVATSVAGTATADAQQVVVFPNPAGAHGWTVAVGNVQRGEVLATLVSPSGAVVRKLRSQHAGGAFTTHVDAQGLADGLYFLRVQGDGVQWTGRVVLQH